MRCPYIGRLLFKILLIVSESKLVLDPIGLEFPHSLLPLNRSAGALHKRLQELEVHTVAIHEPASAAGVLTDPAMINALVVEYDLDGENGWEFARKVRAQRPELCIVLLAQAQQDLDPTQARNAGIDHLLLRPFDEHDVQRAVLATLVERLPAQELTPIEDEKLEAIEIELREQPDGAVAETWSGTGVQVADAESREESAAAREDVTVEDIFFEVEVDADDAETIEAVEGRAP